MTYIFVYIGFAANMLVAISRQRSVTKIVAVLATLMVAVLAIVRGDVGTDTLAYESLVREYMESTTWLGIEPGFIAYVRFAHLFTDNSVLITRGISIVFFLFILIYIRRSTYDELVVLMAYFAPIYFVQMSMNGLRIGIATALLLLALQLFRRRKVLHALLYAGVAVTFHVSILFALVLTAFALIKIQRVRSMAVSMLIMLAIMYFASMNQGYIEQKTLDYTAIVTPGLLSGLSPVGRIVLLLFFSLSLPMPRLAKMWLVAIILTTTMISYYVSLFSYAGLRLLEIIASITPLLLLINIPPAEKLNRKFRSGLMLAGILGGLNVLRGIFESASQPGTPFAPYKVLSDTILQRG